MRCAEAETKVQRVRRNRRRESDWEFPSRNLRADAYTDVTHRRLLVDGVQCPYAADAERDLLADADIDIATASLVGNASVFATLGVIRWAHRQVRY